MARLTSENHCVTIVDSRYEFAGSFDGNFSYDIGDCDVISGADKATGLNNAVRTTSCDVVVCDEISDEDAEAVRFAQSCGVAIFASAHACGIADLKNKSGFEKALRSMTFDLFVVLGDREHAGAVCGVYDGELNKID